MPETATKTCRICLQQVKEDASYHFLNNESDLTLQSKLLDFLPKLDLNITQNPISCSQCTTTINEIHQFIQLCVRNEDIIRNLSLQELPLDDVIHIFKKEQLDETIKEELVEDPIKNEQFSLENVEDKCMQINMDIPVCIEESSSTKSLYYCYNCNYCTDIKENLITHISTHQNEISEHFKCEHCVSSESVDMLQCDISAKKLQPIKCNYTGSKEENLINNQKLKVTDSKIKMVPHVRTHTGKKPFFCNLCDYQSNHMGNLKQHSRVHTGEKPYCCNICDYRSNGMGNLKRHLCTHTGEKLFSCSVCDYRCSQKSRLKQHLLMHIGKKPFCCSICNYSTHDKQNLRRHLRNHTGEKLFACSVCNYGCNYKSRFKEHSRIHTGEKPFCCNICDFRCSVKSVLNQHLRVHTGEKPFSCNICNFRCNDKSSLRQHSRIHTGEKPYCCNICNYRFNVMSHLKRHLRRRHNES